MDVVLPCLDEAAALPAVLASLPRGYRAIVVDNGSTDGSPSVAESCGALVVHEPRRGYGAAVHTGLLAATSDLVAFADADGSLDLGELPAMATLMPGADLVVGRRVPVSAGVWPWHARAGNAVIAGLLRRRGLDVHDIAPLRVCRRSALLELNVQDRAFGYPLELLVRAASSGWRVREVAVTYGPRAAGTRSKVSGSVRGTLRAARDMAGVLR
ncbi:glycosyl transferase family 2 [Lentzea atacamensis]|uniref:Glycosyl transferase family 2 n=1 Tax=Lentzea atacamensis TaxID=531938 RepID=A0A316I522_9PSEU|nr:glycosyltransferase family 2 protein [Lentzea atacamensis]PWK88123.1 glycosyl transferase family 2 [Lentzea atacamensis]